MKKEKKLILWFNEVSKRDVKLVGGKNASLGEMYQKLTPKGIKIPFGFCLTSQAYFYFLKANQLSTPIKNALKELDYQNLKNLKTIGKKIRNLILNASLPLDLENQILKCYQKLSQFYQKENLEVAVRSSATAEDLPSASFAGQHESFLNVKGKNDLLLAIKKCFASLFTDRAIVYRKKQGFDDFKIALSVGIQKMVRSDLGASGVMFSLDTESGFRKVVLINGIYGVGEMIVKGKIIPDEFLVFKETLKEGFTPIISKTLGEKTKKYIFDKKGGLKEIEVSLKDQQKFCLTEKEILTLARWGMAIEAHYKMPQDIEWAKDGKEDELYIVQSRPETVHGQKEAPFFTQYLLKTSKKPILEGIAIGNKIGQGPVHIIKNVAKISQFKKGEVLVTKMTDPDWVPLFPLANAIITEEGGPTCHAAIVSRELGIPCVVGVKNACKILKNGQMVTVDCTQGRIGKIFSGKLVFKIKKINLNKLPKLKTKIMLNIGAPEAAFRYWRLPVEGVGLAREEFIIAQIIRIHPLLLFYYPQLKSKLKKNLIKKVEEITAGYQDKKKFFIEKLAEGIGQIACVFYPKEVIVRFSDFKTNEYRNLIGGELFEAEEANPMLGFRGASRYYDPQFKNAFLMEVEAIKKARQQFGLKNISVMIPFCRTPEEGKKVLELLSLAGLKRSTDNLKVYVMGEIPSNVILVEEFLKIFDGISIGSNDLTQLTLGIDRDNARLTKIADERNEAVRISIAQLINACRKNKKYIGICGQAPSDFPEFAQFLQNQGIESISLNPDSVLETILKLSKK